jgi:hypothetical protein
MVIMVKVWTWRERETYIHTRFLIRDAVIVECWEKSIYVMWGLIIISNSRGQMAPPDSKKLSDCE